MIQRKSKDFPTHKQTNNKQHNKQTTNNKLQNKRITRTKKKKKKKRDKNANFVKRKLSHKEVERRRRDNINLGINELAKIVPDCEKNKGSIVHKSVEYIKYLQLTNLATIEKWREEKKALEDRIRELEVAVEQLQQENEYYKTAIGPPEKKLKSVSQ